MNIARESESHLPDLLAGKSANRRCGAVVTFAIAPGSEHSEVMHVVCITRHDHFSEERVTFIGPPYLSLTAQ